MTKIIQKPLACRNAHCGAMCSMIMAADCMRIFKDPRKCPNYERDDIGYEHEVINKIRAEIEQLPTSYVEIFTRHSGVKYRDMVELGAVARIFDKYKSESEG